MNRLIFRLNLNQGKNLVALGGKNVYHPTLGVNKSYSTSDPPKTLSLQDKVGKLPVPDLKDTVSKFLLTVKPHVNAEEYDATVTKLEKLMEPNGIGEKLQSILLKRREEKDNWFADWWLEMAYLAYRDPLVVWSSPGFGFNKRNFQNIDQQLEFAAKLIVGTLDFKGILDRQELPVEFMGKNPIDMKTYYNIFGTNRVPQPGMDKLIFNPNSKHIIVAHNNNFFKLVVGDDSGKWLNFQQTLQGLKAIMDQSTKLGVGQPVGGLSSDNRDNWVEAYQILQKNNMNSESIKELETALFLIALDGDLSNIDQPDNKSLTALQSLHGFHNYANRWWDKCLQYFVASSGENGCVSEHSPVDGVVIMKIADHAIDYADGRRSVDEGGLPNVEGPKYLKFHVDNALLPYISKSKAHIDHLIDDLQMRVLHFDDFGKNVIKTFKVSPDSFIQMAIQAAFYRTHKVPAATYESGGTRLYKEGRTEAIRSCSMESVNFSKKLIDNSASEADKYNCLINAIQGHNKYAKMATQGFGVDRHFQGIKKAAQLNHLPIPEIYDDPAYLKSARMRLSTSQISGYNGSFTCYGPLQMDGYGCCYSIEKDHLIFAVSAMKSNSITNADTFKANLKQTLLDMRDICSKQLKSNL